MFQRATGLGIVDMSGTLPKRFILLTLQNSFLGKEDLQLTDKLTAELPGIFNWALRGLARLRRFGFFEMPTSSLEAMRTLEDLASPVGAFVRDWCEVGPGKRVDVKVLWGAYRIWCEGEGQETGTQAMFGKSLKAAVPQITTAGKGSRRTYRRIQLNDDGEKGSTDGHVRQ